MSAIREIALAKAIGGSGGGSSVTVEELTVNQNGTTTAPEGTAYNPVNVAVPQGIPSGYVTPSDDYGSDGDLYLKKVELPSSVNFVEYLENSGTQYIDTGFVAGGLWSAYSKFMYLGSAGGIFSARDSATMNAFGVIQTSSNEMHLDYWSQRITKNVVAGEIYETILGPTKNVNGVYKKTNLDINDGYKSFTTPKTVTLFAINAANDYGLVISPHSKIYRVTFRNKGIIVHDYLPALDGNGVACMYDAATQTYCYNAGTGDFAYGNPVNPKEAFDVLTKMGGKWCLLYSDKIVP